MTTDFKTLYGKDKLNYFSLPNRDELLKVSILFNSKKAIEQYNFITKPLSDLKYPNCNVAILTGLKNEIIVIDIDLYKMNDDSLFIKKYGNDINGIVKRFNTLAVKSPKGGLHLYFHYDDELTQTQSDDHFIDIRSNGGYILCPPSSIDLKYYECINNVDIIDIPRDFKEFLLTNLYKKNNKKDKIKNNDAIINDDYSYNYSVNITENELATILLNIPNDYINKYTLWTEILRACKFCNMYKPFDDWSKKTTMDNYDEDNNLRLWNNSKPSHEHFIHMLNIAGLKNTFTFKKINDYNFDNVKYFDREKVGKLFKPKINYLVKSDTGTGKSTSFINYIASLQNKKFISITSRVSLAYEQFNKFKENNIDVKLYDKYDYGINDSIIITPESSILLQYIDISDHILFMDEFDSIIKHILDSSTCSKNRKLIFKMILKMLYSCKQFICVDADISDISKSVLDFIAKNETSKYQFYINKFKNYSGVNVDIIYNEDDFFTKLYKQKKFIVCTDSKDVSEYIYKKLNNKKILLINSLTELKHYNLDDYDLIIYSPKIIYGLDSVMERPVYGEYTCETISPTQMIQQITRCRNITRVYLYFENIVTKANKYDNIDEVHKRYEYLLHNFSIECHDANKKKNNIDYSDFYEAVELDENIFHEEIDKLFKRLFIQHIYNLDSYNTNKKLHVIDIMKNRGFIINDDRKNIFLCDSNTGKSDNRKEILQEIKNEKLENFNIESFKVNNLNEYLNIPVDKISDYADIFIDNNKFNEHMNISNYFFKHNYDNIINLDSKNDFDIKKCDDVKIKMKLLDDMLSKLNLNKNNIHTFKPSNDFKIDNHEELQKKYINLFRCRGDNIDFSKDTHLYRYSCIIINDLFNNLIDCQRKKINGHDIQIRTIKDDVIEYHRTLYNFRKQNKEPKKKIFK